ncbi:DNA mismatch repair protein MutS [Spirochaetia bacterium]|nr:DNA mismatch repair protein MutS [Spirochaetia bacterium]
MDFGDILNAWEKQTRTGPVHKTDRSRNAGQPDASEAEVSEDLSPESPNAAEPDPLAVWLRRNGVYDKDAETEESAARRGARRRRLLAKKADAELDLHGLTRDEAWTALEAFFRAGQQQELEKLLIIHGKGNHTEGEAVLQRTVRQYIEACPFAGESGHGNAAQGGSGATWVLLKLRPETAQAGADPSAPDK